MEASAKLVRYKDREALRFQTACGVTAFVATSVSPILMAALKKKLQRKLNRSGVLRNLDR